MAKFIWYNGAWTRPEDMPKPEAQPGVMIFRDLPGYLSPVGTGWIEGRAARREDLRRAGCVEAGPRMADGFTNPRYQNRRPPNEGRK